MEKKQKLLSYSEALSELNELEKQMSQEGLKLTEKQKLQAIELKYYQNYKWEPKLYDYYTLTRSSTGLTIFQIVVETETEFGIKIVWCDSGSSQEQPTMFDKTTFANEGFGLQRVYLPKWILTSPKQP